MNVHIEKDYSQLDYLPVEIRTNNKYIAWILVSWFKWKSVNMACHRVYVVSFSRCDTSVLHCSFAVGCRELVCSVESVLFHSSTRRNWGTSFVSGNYCTSVFSRFDKSYRGCQRGPSPLFYKGRVKAWIFALNHTSLFSNTVTRKQCFDAWRHNAGQSDLD